MGVVMNTVLYLIIAVLVIAIIGIVGFLIIKNKKQGSAQNLPQQPITHDPNVNVPPLAGQMPQQQPHIEPMQQNAQPQVQAQPEQPQIDTLAIAQHFINQQRYEEAVHELKRGLAVEPNNRGFLLKLLNVYALTNQVEAFNGLYEKIQSQNISEILPQADELKSMLDAEHNVSMPTQTSAQNQSDIGDDMLNMDLSFDDIEPAEQATSAAQENSASNEFDLNLDDGLDFTTHDEQNHEQENELSFDEDNDTISLDELSFDEASLDDAGAVSLDFEEPVETQAAEVTEESFEEVTMDEVAAEEELVFDVSEPLPEAQPATLVEETDEVDFSLDDLEDELLTDTSSAAKQEPSVPELASNQADSTNEFALSLDDDGSLHQSVETPNESTPMSLTDEAVFDDEFNGNEFNIEVEPVESTTESVTKTEEPELSLEDFNIDTDTGIEADDIHITTDGADTASMEASTQSFDDATDFSLDLDNDDVLASPQPSAQSDVVEPAYTLETTEQASENNDQFDTLAQLDALNLEESSPQAPQEAVQPSGSTPVVAPAQKLSTDTANIFGGEFDFVQQLDNSQVTLELALRYLELGEHDSAKRLLSEVVDSGNAQQQQQAKDLLNRVA